MCSDIAIKIDNLSKCYQIYKNPHDRLKQLLYPRVQNLLRIEPKQYFRDFWALKNISLEIKKGEAVGIIGRNGSGKSTLLQIISGILTPTLGNIQTFGRIAALLELGSGFNQEFTGRENIYLNASILGLSQEEIDQKFDKIAAFADIGEHLDQPVKTYSSGMLMRLAFSVQVQVEPDILIIDEALAVGDWLFQKRCFQRIEKLVSNGTTLLFVSHDQESIRTITDKALLLKNGTPVVWGTSSEAVLEYRKILHEEEIKNTSSFLTVDSLQEINKETNVYSKLTKSQLIPLSEKKSFGDAYVKVIKVTVLDSEDRECFNFYPKDRIKIRVTCESFISTKNLNIAIRLRNKEGAKIYSWGTLNQDMVRFFNGSTYPIFWNNYFTTGDFFSVDFICDCSLGENIYEVQASVSYEETPDYLSQRILHWVDEAAFFRVLMKKDEYFFGGIADLRMKAIWP